MPPARERSGRHAPAPASGWGTEPAANPAAAHRQFSTLSFLRRLLFRFLLPGLSKAQQGFQGPPTLPLRKLRGGVQQHNDDQQYGVGQHPVVCHLTQYLRQSPQDDGGDDGAPDGAHAAQHHDHQNFDRHIVVKHGGLDVGQRMTVQHTGHSGEESRQHEHHQLVVRHVDAVGLRCDTVIPDGHDGPAMAGVLQIHHHQHHQKNQHDGKGQQCPGIGVDLAGIQPLGAAGDGEIVDDGLDDLAAGQRHDGQIVALEPQDGEAEHEAKQGRHDAAHGQYGPEAEAEIAFTK